MAQSNWEELKESLKRDLKRYKKASEAIGPVGLYSMDEYKAMVMSYENILKRMCVIDGSVYDG